MTSLSESTTVAGRDYIKVRCTSSLLSFLSLPSMASNSAPRRLPEIKFRVLIIGRANAGKTTILQRVCDTTESPKVYRITDGRREEVGSRNWVFPTSLII